MILTEIMVMLDHENDIPTNSFPMNYLLGMGPS